MPLLVVFSIKSIGIETSLFTLNVSHQNVLDEYLLNLILKVFKPGNGNMNDVLYCSITTYLGLYCDMCRYM